MKYQLRNGLIGEIDKNILNHWYSIAEKQGILKTDAVVYLRADPKKCWNRMTQRGWESDRALTYDYIQSIHQLYEEWIQNGKDISCPVYVINADENEDIVYENLLNIVNNFTK